MTLCVCDRLPLHEPLQVAVPAFELVWQFVFDCQLTRLLLRHRLADCPSSCVQRLLRDEVTEIFIDRLIRRLPDRLAAAVASFHHVLRNGVLPFHDFSDVRQIPEMELLHHVSPRHSCFDLLHDFKPC